MEVKKYSAVETCSSESCLFGLVFCLIVSHLGNDTSRGMLTKSKLG